MVGAERRMNLHGRRQPRIHLLLDQRGVEVTGVNDTEAGLGHGGRANSGRGMTGSAVRWQLTATYDGKSFQESIIAIYRFELCFGVVTVCTHNFLTQMRGQLFGGLSIQNDQDS